MPDTDEAVRRYLAAVASGTDDVYAALAERVADDASASSPLASGTGRDAVLDGLRRAQPMLAAATWAEPVVDGDGVKVWGTLPPGSVLGTATLTFRFDVDGRIAQLQQALTPGAPPPPVAVALDGAISEAVNGALDNGTRLSFFYRDPAARTFLQIQGRGRVDDDPQVRDTVFVNSPEREQSIDPDRRGVAVVVDVDHVQGRLAGGAVNMSRDPA